METPELSNAYQSEGEKETCVKSLPNLLLTAGHAFFALLSQCG